MVLEFDDTKEFKEFKEFHKNNLAKLTSEEMTFKNGKVIGYIILHIDKMVQTINLKGGK